MVALLARIYEIPLQQVHVGNRLLREEMGRGMLTRREQNLIRIVFETKKSFNSEEVDNSRRDGGCGSERVLHIY